MPSRHFAATLRVLSAAKTQVEQRDPNVIGQMDFGSFYRALSTGNRVSQVQLVFGMHLCSVLCAFMLHIMRFGEFNVMNNAKLKETLNFYCFRIPIFVGFCLQFLAAYSRDLFVKTQS